MRSQPRNEPFCFVRLLVSSMISYTFTGEQADLSSIDYRKAEGKRHGTHSLGQVCPERMFLTFLHSTPTLQAVDQPCFANALTGSRNARLSYGFRRKPTKSDFHFIRISVLLLTPPTVHQLRKKPLKRSEPS